MSIAAVVVTFDPSPSRFDALLAATLPQVDRVIVVDNGSAAPFQERMRAMAGDRIEWVPLGMNKGIAAAQNAGIARARAAGHGHVLLLDHDSIPGPDMVARLAAAARTAAARSGAPVAAVGPRYVDERQNNPPPFIRVRGLRVIRCACDSDDDVVEVDYLIASGSLIPLETLDRVGGMHEDLFIDYVDIEWGLRARRLGYRCYGVCGATMRHDLGEEPIRRFGRTIPLHSPLRHYYHFRNAVWLYFHSDLPLHWKCADGWRLLLKFGFYGLFARPALRHLTMMMRGIGHGLAGRLGPIDGPAVTATGRTGRPA